MRISTEQRGQIEARIRAAMDRLLRGELPPGRKCDVKTLAAEADVTRAALYTTYTHLKDEFEARRTRLQQIGAVTDPRQAQVERLRQQVMTLRERVAQKDQTITVLTNFRTTALSRLAAQHEEIERLRAQLAVYGNIRVLRRDPDRTDTSR